MPENNDKPTWFVGKIWETVSTFFTTMFESTWKGSDQIFSGLITKAWNYLMGSMDTYEEDDWVKMLNMFSKQGMIDKTTTEEILKLRKIGQPFNTIVYFMIISTLAKAWMETTMYGASADMRRALNSKYTPELPRVEQILQAAFTAPEKTNEIRKILADSGISDEHIDLMFLANYRIYPEQTVMILWLRKVITDDEMFMRMRELGYTDTRTKEIMQSWSIIPGPSDLFHLVAKEAFEPELVRLMGLGDEFPEEQLEWMEKQGVSRFWSQKYWAAHWEQPSIMQGFEMLHRDVIGLEQLDMLFKTVEIPPYWRDKLTQIAYMPYTRVDVRRMHKTGVLTDEQLLRSYMDLGYDLEHAAKMTEFTKVFNKGSEKDLSKGEILKGYREKLLDRKTVFGYLKALGYDENESNYYLDFEDYKEAKDFQDDQITNIRLQHKKNIISDFKARQKLDYLGLPGSQTDMLLEKWKISRISNTKMPTKEDLGKFLSAGIIDDSVFMEEMQKIGFPEKYTVWFLQLLKTPTKE